MASIATWNAFQQAWRGPLNFLMSGDCVPFAFKFPAIEQVVAELRDEAQARIGSGIPGDRLLLDNTAERFRATPLAEAMRQPFSLAHFKLGVFDAPGRFLHGFERQVLDPWRAALTANGFTFDRCYPIIFISGPGCATNYHLDFSHVLAWQIHGRKRFCGLRDPDRWVPREQRVNYKAGGLARPPELDEARDALCFDMPPGAVLWNILLTPHWVNAGQEVAMSVNLSHGGLRWQGHLSPHEQELEDFRRDTAGQAPPAVKGSY
jgi:hypothetical protein